MRAFHDEDEHMANWNGHVASGSSCQEPLKGHPDATEYAPGTVNIKGWIQKEKTCGIDLKDTPYSSTLKQMIFECLYEDYELRPKVIDLKNRIQQCLKVAISANPRGDEPWEDFVHPKPKEDD